MSSRQQESVGPPPQNCDELAALPSFDPGVVQLFRCCPKKHSSPWHFSTAGGRFDLSEGSDGTCYLANDVVGALRESLGPGGTTTASRAFFTMRQVWVLDCPQGQWRGKPVADLLDERWNGSGVTQELFTILPFDRPQAWAMCIRRAGFDGLRYHPRHVLSAERFAMALFGPKGAQPADDRLQPTGQPRQIDSALLADFTSATGIQVEASPVPADGLDVIS